jgi:hypothetical protein
MVKSRIRTRTTEGATLYFKSPSSLSSKFILFYLKT